MATVFISYRREDSRYQARSIYNAFVKALPPDSVFMDVDSIKPGDDFVEILEGWVQQCEVLLALIGPGWINSADPKTGLRRLDNPEDFVRIEIRGALERRIPVVPVLLDAAQMPAKDELPGDINALTRRHAEFVDFRTFDTDVERLIRRLQIGKDTAPVSPDPVPTAPIGGQRQAAGRGLGVRATGWISKSFSWPAMPLWVLAVGALLLAAAPWIKNPATIDLADGQRVQAAITAAEAARQAAEKKAGAAADALAQSEKARQASEARASAASASQAKAEAARQDAESRASASAGALAKSEQARKDAEARLTAQVKTPESIQSKTVKPRNLLDEIGPNSRWTTSNSNGACNTKKSKSNFTLEVSASSVTWRDDAGGVDVELINASSPNEFKTMTRSSVQVSRENTRIGRTWTYSREDDRINYNTEGSMGTFTRCP